MAYKDALSGEQIDIIELYKIIYADATEDYFTSRTSFTFDGDTYTPLGLIERTPTNRTSDLSPGEMRVSLAYDSGVLDLSEIQNNRKLDNAVLELYQVQVSNVANYRLAFKGTVADVNINATVIEITFKDRFNIMLRNVPRKGYFSSCPYHTYDSDCGLLIANFTETGTGGAGSTTGKVVDAGRTEDNEYFNGGYVEITSGSDSGEFRPIASYVTGTITLLIPFNNTTLGETYNAVPSCEKKWTKCSDAGTFNNEANFGAFQYIPRPEERFV